MPTCFARCPVGSGCSYEPASWSRASSAPFAATPGGAAQVTRRLAPGTVRAAASREGPSGLGAPAPLPSAHRAPAPAAGLGTALGGGAIVPLRRGASRRIFRASPRMVRAGVVCNRRPTRHHCAGSPAERWSSPMDHTLRPRNTRAASGYSTQPTWMRPRRGDATPSSPAAHRSRCASSSQCQRNRDSNPSTRRLT